VRIARIKLQHDLYDRRFAVFQAARKLLAEVMTQGFASDDQIRLYVVGTADAGFLLSEEVSKYLEEIRKRASSLEAIQKTLRPLPVGDQRTASVAQEQQIFSWLMEQLPGGLVERFKPFLTLEKHSRG
jgi:CHASE3 domain sensor protein